MTRKQVITMIGTICQLRNIILYFQKIKNLSLFVNWGNNQTIHWSNSKKFISKKIIKSIFY